MSGPARRMWAALVGLALGTLAIGPGLAPGFVLSYDMVFVPGPRFTAMTFGLTGTVPRHVPSDAAVTALSTVLPGGLAQKAVLLAIFVMACVSAASLVPTERVLPGLAAGVLYAWNPFVAERLLLGQWALLLGYAALPWVVLAAARVGERNGAARLVCALAPAAVGGFAAMAVSGVTALIVTAAAPFPPRRARPNATGTGSSGRWEAGPRRRLTAVARTGACLLMLCLPWLVTGLFRPAGVPADEGGVAAFAARADTPFGAVGSLLLLGGVWNRETVPAGYGAAPTAVAWLLLVLAALIAFARRVASGGRADLSGGADLGGGADPNGRAAGEPWLRGLAVAALAGFTIAAAGAVLPGVPRFLIRLWPGFSVLRDGQQYVAPLAVAVAVGVGLLVAALVPSPDPALVPPLVPGGSTDATGASPVPAPAAGRVPGGRSSRRGALGQRLPKIRSEAGPVLAAAIAVLPLVLLPSLAWGAAGRLRAVDYPAGWAALRRTVAMDRTPGDVVVLPWAAYRSYPWNHGRRVLDPLPRFLDRRVIVNDAVQVGGTAVAAEDPRARRIDAILRAPGPVTAPLRAAGVRYVVLDAETAPGGPLRDRMEGAELVLDRPDVVAYRLADPAPARERATPAWAVWCAWTLTLLTLVISAIMWSIRVSPTTLVTLTPRRKIKTWKGP